MRAAIIPGVSSSHVTAQTPALTAPKSNVKPIKASQHMKLGSERQSSLLSHDPSDRNAAAIVVCKLGSKKVVNHGAPAAARTLIF